MLRRLTAAALVAAGLAGLAVPTPAAADGEVNVYSYRQEVLIRPLLDRFTEETGIEVNVVFAKQGMIERLQAEGMNSPADAILTVDAGRLIEAKQADVLQPVETETLNELVPAQYRDPEGYWYGVSVRARPIMYAPDRVDPDELSTYEDLASDKWQDRICVRSSSNIYNQSMLASFVAHWGKDEAERWTEDFVDNFAREPKGGDRDQIRAVAAGQCDVALANTYYLAGLATSDDPADRAAADKVEVFWPNQNGRGAHVNISGAAVTKAAPNKENAIALIEFLAGDEAQRMYAHVVQEYPIREDVEASEVVESWGEFKADKLNLSVLATHNAEAVRIMDRAGWR